MRSASQKKQRREKCHGLIFEWAGSVALIMAVFLAYSPALNGGFLWDDEAWTSNIEPLLRDVSGLWQMWSNPVALQQYYPLTGTTFWLDHQLWGEWTLPYHVENLLLHLSGAFLFWRLLRRLNVGGAWLAGAIFAVHPVMVESVAWITERKNVLSMVLLLAAFLAYERFTPFSAATKRPRSRGWYIAAFVLFIGALLAKVTAFAFPAVLLVLCWWKRGTVRWRDDVVPTLPFFAIAIGFGLGISWLEKHSVGAHGAEWDMTWPERFLLAGRALWFYAGKLFLPVNQSFIYPQWEPGEGSLLQWLMPVGVAAVIIGLWLALNRIGRGPLAALLIFAGTLFPVLGFMNVYGMRFSVVADHWVYLPALAFIALAASMLSTVLGRNLSAVVVLLPLLLVLTWRQADQYKGMETLWRVTLAKNPACWMAHNNLGNLLLEEGHFEEATTHFEEALRLRPGYAEAFGNLGEAHMHQGKPELALPRFRRALELDPGNAASHYNLGNALLQQGAVNEAIAQFEKALVTEPDHEGVHNNLGVALVQMNRIEEAVSHYRRALQLRPRNAEAMVNLGAAVFAQGKGDDAISLYEQALALQPEHSGAHNNLGMALLQKNRIADAMPHFQKSIDLRPSNPEAHYNLAKCLLETQKPEDAIGHYEIAVKLSPGYVDAHYGMGIALSRTGRIKESMAQYRLSIEAQPARADARINLGNALLQAGEKMAAVEQLRKAVELEPGNTLSHNSLGNALLQTGQRGEAVGEFEAALKLSPDNWAVMNNLSWILATTAEDAVRDGARAVNLGLCACKASPQQNPVLLRTLAAAYAEAGKFAEAVSTAEAALRLARDQGNMGLATAIAAMRLLYEARTPYRDSK